MWKLFLTSLLCCFAPILFANTQQYQIELLVFSHLTPATLTQEQWPIEASNHNPITDTAINPSFKTVNPSQFILKKEANALSKRANYRVLYHAAWRTSAATLAKTRTLIIQTGASALDDSELNGQLRISLDRYFDTHLQLYLNEPTNQLKAIAGKQSFDDAPSMFHFLLNQQRRLRSRELNYFAEPTFGALLKIVPIGTNMNH